MSFRFIREACPPPVVVEIDPASQAANRIATWFASNARQLPWRVPGVGSARNPYHALVAEAMLQQTQVSRVIEKFSVFIECLPSIRALATADEDQVLALWSGLGYYRRAKNLHTAAKIIVEKFGGVVPRSVEDLMSLPGVGRYTAGAIASIAYNQPAPIVDGNVARVLLRLHARDVASDDKESQGWLWQRAAELAASGVSPGKVNEGLMELGATVCLPGPAEPKCNVCPLAGMCGARERNLQGSIPRAKIATVRKDVYCLSVVLTRESDGALLVEQREDRGAGGGMWAGLWQAVTFEDERKTPSVTAASRALGLTRGVLKAGETFEFLATHRRMMFSVMRGQVASEYQPVRGRFYLPEEIATKAISNPQRRILLESK